jgi:hypothetical protein
VPVVRDAAAAPTTTTTTTTVTVTVTAAAVTALVAMRSGPFAQVMSVRGLVAG